ncbi:MAG: membrane protein insertase YidC [Acidiferrobacter sp.]
MNNYRPVLYVLLAVILFTIWTDWQHWRPPVSGPAPAASALPAAPGISAPSAPTAATAAPTVAQPLVTQAVAPSVVVKTAVLTATLSAQGADITDLLLRRYSADKSHGKRPYALLKPSGHSLFSNENGLLGRVNLPNHTSVYQTRGGDYSVPVHGKPLAVHFRWHNGAISVVKTYTFTADGYTVPVQYAVHNAGPKPITVYLYNQFLHSPPPKTHLFHSAPIYIGAAYYTPQAKYQKAPFPQMLKHPLHVAATGGWVAVSQHYFLGAAIPGAKSPAIFYSSVLAGPRYVVGYKTARPLVIAPGQTGVLTTRLFLGPKTPSILKAVAPGLNLTVDYGWLTVLSQPLYWVLAHIEAVVGNWGISIILLTVLIKVIFFPLSAASFKSMAKMRKLQPRMAALKERHGADKAALQQAMMEMYKTEKMNPLGGCLPMIVQIPVFIALYWVLLDSVALRDAPFLLWIHNLAAPDPYFVLPILMGLSMLAQQMLNPAMMDPTQRKVMMVMPVIFTGFFLFFPAGLVLYWVTNNVLSILQQQWVMARVDKA